MEKRESERYLWNQYFPRWVVRYLVGPFADEVGSFEVRAKWSAIGVIVGLAAGLAFRKDQLPAFALGLLCAWVALRAMSQMLKK